MALIELTSVTKTYVVGEITVAALSRVDLDVAAGEFVAVVGPSGSGKSTLLNLIAAIDLPSAGSIHVGGVDVGALRSDAAARWRGRNVGVVFQFFQMLPTLTLVENVMLPMDLCRVHARRARGPIARDLLERVGIADLADKLPSQVSGGEQQRAAIARALANDPPVLVADEPTGNLDSANAAAVMDLFADLSDAGRTVLMVTHDRDQAELADRIVVVRDGALLTASTDAP